MMKCQKSQVYHRQNHIVTMNESDVLSAIQEQVIIDY